MGPIRHAACQALTQDVVEPDQLCWWGAGETGEEEDWAFAKSTVAESKGRDGVEMSS